MPPFQSACTERSTSQYDPDDDEQPARVVPERSSATSTWAPLPLLVVDMPTTVCRVLGAVLRVHRKLVAPPTPSAAA
ncbi:hypothetical protein GCM10009858_14930 [Terrabacter carboxydivorans]|uniref:Uncharacterized protein n=1 Tax=Terrabacter carboxydivorans TaxID=619730 RepID=A0ABN3L665_9MICO